MMTKILPAMTISLNHIELLTLYLALGVNIQVTIVVMTCEHELFIVLMANIDFTSSLRCAVRKV